jgi:hypothetical protein
VIAGHVARHRSHPVRRSDDRWIEIGKITDWLRAVGIAPEWGRRGCAVVSKDQFLRHAFAHFSMVFKREDGFQCREWGSKGSTVLLWRLLGNKSDPVALIDQTNRHRSNKPTTTRSASIRELRPGYGWRSGTPR